jgi:phosphatidylserine decarboxylase
MKSLHDWINTDVKEVRDKPLTWLSHQYFFRDPPRPLYSDPSLFLSPADGVILYQRIVDPDEPIVELKGLNYSLREALRNPSFAKRSLVIGIFMTFFDVHVNRMPYPGRLSYRALDPIDTYNHPMLEVEQSLLDDLRVPTNGSGYLHHNQRVVNQVASFGFEHPYYVLQVADYDVDCITPFEVKQNQPVMQGERFSMIRFGSQVDLIIPLSASHDLVTLQETGVHVEAGLDPLVRITDKRDSMVADKGK